MSFSALQNIPIVVDLLQDCNDTGWTIDGTIATHSSCNAGSIKLLGYTLLDANTYQVSYAVLSISDGYVQLFAGTTGGIQRTTANIYVETIVANGAVLSFFSNANCQIQAFNIRNAQDDTSNTQQNTIVYSTENRKWSEFRTIAPDYGASIYIDMLTMFHGELFLHENGSDERNNFYGTQYQSIFRLVENKLPQEIKSYNSIAIQANEIMVTGDDGILTSLGQISELAEQDFIKSTLRDAVSVTSVEAQDGIYSASFLKDKNFDLINGDALKGTYIIVTLMTVNGSAVLKLFTVAVNASQNKLGIR